MWEVSQMICVKINLKVSMVVLQSILAPSEVIIVPPLLIFNLFCQPL